LKTLEYPNIYSYSAPFLNTVGVIIRTSAKVASKASKALKSNNATKSIKSIAGSALVNRTSKK